MMRKLNLLLTALLLLAAAGMAVAVEGDIVFKRKGEEAGFAPAVFPHWIHRIRYKCYACHDEIFKMKAGDNSVTMDALAEGKFCGACHDGKAVWGVTLENCDRCHVRQ